MKIGVLTSSRADFGIYLPLLKEFKRRSINFEIIAFGTHLSYFHGYTLNEITKQGFEVKHKLETLLLGDSEEAIASSIGLTTLKFASFWAQHAADFDVVFCLGDRYEMFAAVTAGIPFNVNFAHLHGGEKTMGAIDNVFRHAITHASKIHFTSTDKAAERVKIMIDEPAQIYNVGALSLDSLADVDLYTDNGFFEKWEIDLNLPTILFTFHPETVTPKANTQYAYEVTSAIKDLTKYQVVVTMPNADTAGNILRDIFIKELANKKQVHLIENFGTKAYFTIMKKCSFLLGNTSSGIIEAASFGKYVINLGDRQKGRINGENVIHTPINKHDILEAVHQIETAPILNNQNVYFNGGAANKIIEVLNQMQ